MWARAVFAASLSLISFSASAVFKCQEGGRTVFQDAPCAGGGGKEIEVRPATGSQGAARSTPNATVLDAQNRADAMERSRNARDLGYEIRDQERLLDRLRERRDAELASLRAAKGSASNNLAGATREQSLSTEMQAVIARYESEIRIEQARLEQMRTQRVELSGARP